MALFQYSFCSYSTITGRWNRRIFFCFNTASVLIQRVFIVERKWFFRFNTASVLIQLDTLRPLPSFLWFQYSFCSYSTAKRLKWHLENASFNTASVLIQQYCQIFCNHLQSFNTASVLIQLKLEYYVLINEMFQYSFCSYSTLTLEDQEVLFFSFNTASVLIQPSIFQYSL